MIDTALTIPFWTYVTFLGAASILYITPGPDMMFTLASGMRGGTRDGVAAAGGISLGILGHVVMAAAGLAVLLIAYPLAYDAIRYAGAAYLVWLAIATWRASDAAPEPGKAASGWRAFRRGFVTNILNPKVALFVLAFLPQFTNPAYGPVWQQIIILGTILAIGEMAVYAAIGSLAGHTANRMTRMRGLINKLTACVFGALAVRLALD